MDKKILAIIPARGGSKGIKRKNLMDLEGVPLIAWTINAALESKYLTRVIVSTEDDEIAGVARQYGADIPFMRPVELAGDNVGGIETTLHAVNWMVDNEEDKPDYFMLLQPTSPLRSTTDIDAAIELALKNDADNLVSVCQVNDHPIYAMSTDNDGRMKPYLDCTFDEIMEKYHDVRTSLMHLLKNGAIYMSKIDNFIETESFYHSAPYTYTMSHQNSVDIDNMVNFYVAEAILKNKD